MAHVQKLKLFQSYQKEFVTNDTEFTYLQSNVFKPLIFIRIPTPSYA